MADNNRLENQCLLFPEVSTPPTNPEGHPVSILVVDDEQRVRQSICDILKPLGYRTIQAESVSEAIKWLKSEQVTIALVDLNLADGTGHEIMHYIQDKHSPTRVIVISGESTFDHASLSLRNGACDFLRKPYLPAALLKTVTKEINKAQTQHRYHQIQKELKGSEALHRFIVHNSPDIIYMLDHEGRFSFVNRRVGSLLGYREKNLIGQHYSTIVYKEDIEKAKYALNERRTGDRATFGAELRLVTQHTQEVRFVESHSLCIELTSMGIYRPANGSSTEFIGTYGIIRDITERKRSEALQQHHYYFDHLTNLPNRALFNDRLHIALAQARRSKTPVAVLFLDIDRFRAINDRLGHLAGDKILQRIAQRLKSNLREEDTLARIGGDEFLLLLPRISKIQDALQIAEKINQSGSVAIPYQDQELYLTFSIGIATFPEVGCNEQDLIRCAELAKYQVKENGRDGHAFYQNHSRHIPLPTLEMEQTIRRGLEQNEFELHYQPQIDTVAKRVIGLEALLRWKRPEDSERMPADLIAVAEQSDLICALGKWTIERACRDGQRLQEHSLTDLKISVNVSMQQIDRYCLKNDLLENIERYNVDQNQLEVELTESSIMKNMDRSAKALNSLTKYGIGVAIDDFGTGYSSLSYLQSLPVSTLKIDRSFVTKLCEEENKLPIIKAILHMAKALNLRCIAEGVENEEQDRILQQAGCTIIQGYHYCRPLPLNQLIPYLKQSRQGTLHHRKQLRAT
nr:EAL domain-containing protein [uncultured Desulfuromonas sp.]